jgi:hypothetical protein
MKDEPLIERLRCQSPYLKGSSAELLMNEAADEIERLRKRVAELQAALDRERPKVSKRDPYADQAAQAKPR